MEATYWQKQTDKPLFPELEWNKPERRNQAGKLLILGGHVHSLEAPAKAYDLALKAGIGQAAVALPSKTKSLVGTTLPSASFLPSTTSGEFSQEGVDELLGQALWADTILLAGDIGRNSQTTILLETLLGAYKETVVITKDAFDSISSNPKPLLEREQTTLVVTFAQLQKLVKTIQADRPLVFSMDLVQLVSYLHTFTEVHAAAIVTLHQQQLIVAAKGQVNTTKIAVSQTEPLHWRIPFSALAACYQTWYPTRVFEALTQTAHACTQLITPVP